MIGLSHRLCRAAIDAAFVGPIGRRRWQRTRAHMDRCDDCRTYHDRLGAASRALGDAPVIDRVAERVVAEHRRPEPRRRWLVPATAALASAAALIIAVVITSDSSDRSEPQPRGARQAPLVPGERQPGVRLFCVSGGDSALQITGESRAEIPSIATPELECTIDGELQLAYSTPSLEGVTMVAFSREPTGETHFYAPRSAHEPAVELVPDVVDEPLGWSTRLGAAHRPGDHELIVRFFDRPVTASYGSSELAAPLLELRAGLTIAEGGLR